MFYNFAQKCPFKKAEQGGITPNHTRSITHAQAHFDLTYVLPFLSIQAHSLTFQTKHMHLISISARAHTGTDTHIDTHTDTRTH